MLGTRDQKWLKNCFDIEEARLSKIFARQEQELDKILDKQKEERTQALIQLHNTLSNIRESLTPPAL